MDREKIVDEFLVGDEPSAALMLRDGHSPEEVLHYRVFGRLPSSDEDLRKITLILNEVDAMGERCSWPVKFRFGFFDGRSWTYRRIAQVVGYTVEHVRTSLVRRPLLKARGRIEERAEEDALKNQWRGKTPELQELMIPTDSISLRAWNCIGISLEIERLVDLAQWPERYLLKDVRNCGHKTVDELRELLARHGLKFRSDFFDETLRRRIGKELSLPGPDPGVIRHEAIESLKSNANTDAEFTETCEREFWGPILLQK